MAEELTLREKLSENQTLEKTGLMVVATTLIPAGIGLINSMHPQGMEIVDHTTGIVLILIGVLSIVVREVLKLRR